MPRGLRVRGGRSHLSFWMHGRSETGFVREYLVRVAKNAKNPVSF
ncbi:hypothetical protein [Microcoleus sp.]